MLCDKFREMSLLKASQQVFASGLRSVLPSVLINQTVSLRSTTLFVAREQYLVDRNVYVVGFGKAVLGMAAALDNILQHHIVKGIISIPVGLQETFRRNDNTGNDCHLLQASSKIRAMEGALNNLPDENAMKTSWEIVNLIKSLRSSDLLFVLVSGGGSALLPLPVDDITIDDKQVTVELLSKCGATIDELNTVRSCLSQVKGGKLAMMASHVPTIALILSDIIGNPLQLIASGPTVSSDNEVRHKSALSIIDKYNTVNDLPTPVWNYLALPCSIGESNPPARTQSLQNVLVGSNAMALDAMELTATELGYDTFVLTASANGEASMLGKTLVEIAYSIFSNERFDGSSTELVNDQRLQEIMSSFQSKGRVCLLLGGETTVTVNGKGKGGRNQELALAAVTHLETMKQWLKLKSQITNADSNFVLLSGGTDGQDGPTPATGAICAPSIATSAYQQGLDPSAYLKNNDSYTFFSTLSDGKYLLETGLTGTNVMDLQVMLLIK